MKGIIILPLLYFFSSIYADDKTECLEMCNKKLVGSQEDIKACEFGCEARKSLTQGIFGYNICISDCVKEYPDEDSSDNQKSCKFACSLPFDQRYSVVVDMTGDKPTYKVKEQTGGAIARLMGKPQESQSGLLENFEDALMKPRIPSIANLDNIDEDFAKINRRMENLINGFLRSIANENRKLFRTQGSEGEVYQQRPSGHESIAFNGPIVGNNMNGNDMIFTIKEPEQAGFFSHRIHSMRWMILMFAFVFLAITLLFVMLFFYRTRTEHYVRMRSFQRSNEASMAPPLPVKKEKIMEEGSPAWAEKEPGGEAPPAYDQLSIHSINKDEVPK